MSVFEAIEPTWPPLRRSGLGPLTLRSGDGGGKRVSAATMQGSALPEAALLDQAEAKMRAMGQVPLFSVTPEQTALDAALARRGYARVDPTRLYRGDVAALAAMPLPRLAAFAIWEPLAIMEEIWAEGGIGTGRRRIMHRVSGARTGLFGRAGDKAAGAGFVGVHGPTAMLHALEVRAAHRRKGLARNMVIAAAQWAQARGCTTLGLAVTEANAAANALYRSLGFEALPGYHYRRLTSAH